MTANTNTESGTTKISVADLMIDTGTRQVSRDSKSLDIGGLTFDLLLAIVEAAPNIVSSDSLVEKVWSGRPTSPETITQRAMMLRHALGDDADNPKYVEVVRGQGFRLIPAIQTNTRSPTLSRIRVAVSITAVAAVALFVYWSAQNIKEAREAIPNAATPVAEVEIARLPHSVAVLPFANLSPNPENAFFAAGLHGEILNQLGKVKDLNVIARTSVLQYENAARPITEIGSELNVETVMEGSVSYADGRVAVRMQLIDADSGVQLWSQTYNDSFSDIFSIQADIASNVASALEAEFSEAEQETIRSIPTDSPEAYALYLQAQSDWTLAPDYLDQAVLLDPNFALAYATRAQITAWGMRFGVPDPELRRRVEETAVRNATTAISLDPSLGIAHTALGLAHEANLNGHEALREFRLAYELSPNDADVLQSYGRFMRNIGNYDEAIRLGERTVELDPNNTANWHQLGVTYRFARRADDARAAFTESLRLIPTGIPSHTSMALTLAQLGLKGEALTELKIVEQLIDEDTIGQPIFRFSQLVVAYRLAGGMDHAIVSFERFKILAESRAVRPIYWATAYIGIGDYEEALATLEEAARDPSSVDIAPLMEIKANAWMDPELERPEFQAVFSKLGFTEEFD